MKPATRAPFYASMYHGLCETARKHGYALAIHGTVTADLDLIAVPWTKDAAPAEVVRDALMKHIGAVDYGDLHRNMGFNENLVQQIVTSEHAGRMEPHDESGACLKPHGRRAWNLYLDHGCKVDLSVMPRAEAQP